jgi:formate C-acetyltransferase
VWFVHLIQQMESSGHSVSLGRFDQYLYPYYERDLQSGEITQENPGTVEHFYLKVFSIIKLRTESHSRHANRAPTYQKPVRGRAAGRRRRRGQPAELAVPVSPG